MARLGLLKAIDGYDDTRANGFPAYATPTILGELRRHFRDRSWAMRVPRDLKEALPRIRSAVADLATEKGRMPDDEEVADATNMEESEVREALEASRAARPASLDAPASTRLAEDGAIPLVEQVGVRDEHLDQVEYNVILAERLKELTVRDRLVLHLSFVEDLTQSEIGERIGVSQMQVSRIIRSALERLRESDAGDRLNARSPFEASLSMFAHPQDGDHPNRTTNTSQRDASNRGAEALSPSALLLSGAVFSRQVRREGWRRSRPRPRSPRRRPRRGRPARCPRRSRRGTRPRARPRPAAPPGPSSSSTRQ